MAGIFPNETSIYIAPSGTVASALAASHKISGEITNWSLTGGDQDVESIPVIGGFVDKESPRSQFEVSFDVIVQNTAASTLDRYDLFKYDTGLTSATEGTDKTIAVSFYTNGSTKLIMMNNCRTITWEPGMAADDMLRGTINFKFSPTTATGTANLKTSTATGSSLPALTW